MSKYLLGAAAAALIMVAGHSGALASHSPGSDADCQEQFGDPHSNGYWVKVPVSGGSRVSQGTTEEVTNVSFSGKSGNATGDISEVETFLVTGATFVCQSYNNGDQLKGTTEEFGGGTTLDYDITPLGNQQVCQNSGQQSGTSLVDGFVCENPRWN